MTKQVICISWGTKYGAPYVNRLYAMVARNITPAFLLHLLHRQCRGLPPGSPRRAAAAARRRDADRHQGHLAQGAALERDLADLTGPVLFMDLDLVVVGLARRLLQLRRPRRGDPRPQPKHPARTARPDLALPLPGRQAPAAARSDSSPTPRRSPTPTSSSSATSPARRRAASGSGRRPGSGTSATIAPGRCR